MPGKRHGDIRQIPRGEWIAAAIGATLVVAAISILVYHAATSANSPPRLTVRAVSTGSAGEQFLVQIEVENHGGSTAAGVTVEAELLDRGAVIERSEATLEFVPPASTQRAGVFFSRDPRRSELKLRASGYHEP
jgi:uncharacterized protein (TIGR02588 family)